MEQYLHRMKDLDCVIDGVVLGSYKDYAPSQNMGTC